MSNPFHNFDWSLKSIGKVFGAFLLGVVGLAVVVGVVSFTFQVIMSPFGGTTKHYEYAQSDMAFEESASFGRGGASYKSYSQSYSNIAPPIPGDDGEIIDADAEDYEVRNYNANYRTNDKTEICNTIASLKSRKEIVFEDEDQKIKGHSCFFYFEVENEYVDEVLQILKDLDPNELSARTRTIQKSVEGTIDRLEILQQKLAQKEAASDEILADYEDLMKIAKSRYDSEELTGLLNLKLRIVDDLFQEKISIGAEIDSVQRYRQEQLRQIAYTKFSVSVYEEKFVDWDNIAEDWKHEIREFVEDINKLIQFVSINLVNFVLYALVAVLYVGVAFGFLKLIWILGKKVWKFGK